MKNQVLIFISFILYCTSAYSQTLFPYNQHNKWMYVDSTMKQLSRKSYSFIFPFSGTQAIVAKKGKYGVIDNNEKTIVRFKYDTISGTFGNYICTKGKKSILLSEKGEIKQPSSIGYCGGAYEISVPETYKANGKTGLMLYNKSKSAYDSLPALYDEIRAESQNFYYVRIGSKWGTISSKGKVIAECIIDYVERKSYFQPNDYTLTKYYQDNLIGFINYTGSIVSLPKFKECFFNYGKFTLIKTVEGKIGYIDFNGKEYFN